MDKPKSKNNPQSLRFYWYFFIPLTVILALMIYFPLRIAPGELLLDTIFYGAIMLACIISAIRVFLRFHKRGRRLTAVILLCVLLSGWQVFDLAILRTGAWVRWPGKIYYSLRFVEHNPYDCTPMLSERFISHTIITIAYDINRRDLWVNCGG